MSSGSTEKPSRSVVIEQGNLVVVKPIFLMLGDTNVDFISANLLAATGIAYLLEYIDARITAAALLLTILPLRLIFPRPNLPKGAYGVDVDTISIDLYMPGSAQEVYEGITVDVLINNAALGAAGDPFEQPVELVERMTTFNCISLVQLSLKFGNDMIRRGRGWTLHVSSVGGALGIKPRPKHLPRKQTLRAAFSEALSIELRAYPGITNILLMAGSAHTQFITRAYAEETVMMAASGAVEDPRSVAMVGYKALCKGKHAAFSSWNAMLVEGVDGGD
ncbi:uncharacterized protein BDV17DRAFT_295758 [Aspergillus undulatus]|uniref:uncharacterized protein n=1 Tax=Aspergillus undulatus TaxID=1810928 RepID=UPI003CCE5092